MLGRWFRRGKPAKPHGDKLAEATEGDPRGGLQSEEYRSADPREIVEDEGAAMSGPGGAPQEGSTAEERHAEQRDS
jgi:hypothetical protein